MIRSGLVCFDEERRCIFANHDASEILGLPPEKLIGGSSGEILELLALRQESGPDEPDGKNGPERKESAALSFALSFDNAPESIDETTIKNGAAAGAITLLAGLDPGAAGLIRNSRQTLLLFRQKERIRQQWEIIMDSIGDAVFLLDQDNAVGRCNQSAKKILGKEFSEIIGRNIWVLLHKSGIEAYHSDKVELHQKNTGKWFVLNSYPCGDAVDETPGTVLTLYDSTALKKARELEEKNILITDSREKLQTALDGISALMNEVVGGKGFEVRFENPSLPRCHEVRSCKKADCPCYGADASRCWQTPKTCVYGAETPGPTALGSFAEKIKDCSKCAVFKEATKDPIYQIGEHFNNMMYLLELNSRELARAHARLESAHYELAEKTALIIENSEKLETALDGISALIHRVVEGKGFEVRFENPALPRCYELLSCDNLDCPCYGSCRSRCGQESGTFCGGKPQGTFAEKLKDCSQCAVFRKATEDPVYQIGEYFNNMMHLLDLGNRKLASAYAELKSTQSKILQQDKMASIGQLAAGVAHEINNPMAFVTSNLNSLRKYTGRLSGYIEAQSEALERISGGQDAASALGRLDEVRRRMKIDGVARDIETLIAESLDGTERVRQIVRNLKNFAHVDESGFKYADINAGLASTINIVWNELKYKTELETDYGEIPLVNCNPGQLNQVFLNLLVNAAQAIEKHGRLTIRTWSGPGHVYVSVSDTGCGIPPENITRIFEPFFTTKEVGKGTGLGLSIAYDIVKKHGGEITVESAPGAGTTFTLKIPIGAGAPSPAGQPNA
ncbi:MAG: ATP-binding protein [Nitrospiraceae bacterium]|nr:ATP-binding protein [Nitrospiraceae bacterium]